MRCVNCGYPKESHGDQGECVGSSSKFASMELPLDKTCSDYGFYLRFCKAFIGLKGTERSCDWFPIRFVPVLKP